MTSTLSPQSHSVKKSVAIASTIMAGSILLSRILGIVRESVLAHFGGTSVEIDAYVAAFFIPEIINHLLAGGFMSITFIPIFQQYLVKNDDERTWKIFSNILSTGSFILVLFIAVCMVFTDQMLGLMGTHIADPATRSLTVRLTRIILPAQLFLYWGALLMAVQYAHKRFFIPALAPLCYNLGIITGGILLYPVIGIEGFAWGVLAGAIIGNCLIQIPATIKLGMRFRFTIDIFDSDLKRYFLITLPLIIGVGMQFSNEVLFRYFGSFLGVGGIASLNYSLRTMLVLVGIFGQSFGVASFPFLTELAVQKRFNEMNRLALDVIKRIAVLIIPCSGLMMALSTQVVAILYQHGRFTAESTAATAPVLSFYLIGAVAIAAMNIIPRLFYALQKTLLPMVICTITVVASLPAYWVLCSTMGARGIACMGSILAFVQCIVLYGFWLRRSNGFPALLPLFKLLVIVTAVSAVGSLSCFAIVNYLQSLAFMTGFGAKIGSVIICCIAGIPALAMIFTVLELMRVPSYSILVNMLKKKK